MPPHPRRPDQLPRVRRNLRPANLMDVGSRKARRFAAVLDIGPVSVVLRAGQSVSVSGGV